MQNHQICVNNRASPKVCKNHKISPFSRIISPSQTERTSKTDSFSRITFPSAFPLDFPSTFDVVFTLFWLNKKSYLRKTKSYAKKPGYLRSKQVYSKYDKYSHLARRLTHHTRNHRRRRAGVSHGKYHYERGDEIHNNDRQRLEHHLQMRPARQWHPPAGCLRQSAARRQCGARGCVLDDDRRQRGAAALRPTRVRPAFS
jgi:hypothetical protein